MYHNKISIQRSGIAKYSHFSLPLSARIDWLTVSLFELSAQNSPALNRPTAKVSGDRCNRVDKPISESIRDRFRISPNAEVQQFVDWNLDDDENLTISMYNADVTDSSARSQSPPSTIGFDDQPTECAKCRVE